MEKNLYYIPPDEKCFVEVKEKSIEIWQTYDNDFGYVDEKVNRIKNIHNVGDNFMYMVAMFDSSNMRKLALKLSKETRKAIRKRMIAGGNSSENIIF